MSEQVKRTGEIVKREKNMLPLSDMVATNR